MATANHSQVTENMNMKMSDVPTVSPNSANAYELIDSPQLAERWRVPESWVRNHTRNRTPREDRIPCIRLGRYVRYWERRNVGGAIERKRVTQFLSEAVTRGKRPPADVQEQATLHMATLSTQAITAERIVTVGDFVERVYLPWVKQHKRPSTA